MSPVTRRAVLAGLPLAAVTVPAAVAAAPVADTELLALGVEFERLYAAEDAARAAPDDDGPHAWDAWDAAYERTSVLVNKIEHCRATTLAGLRVKARAFHWTHSGDDDGLDGDTTDVRLANGILRDLLALSDPQSIWGGA